MQIKNVTSLKCLALVSLLVGTSAFGQNHTDLTYQQLKCEFSGTGLSITDRYCSEPTFSNNDPGNLIIARSSCKVQAAQAGVNFTLISSVVANEDKSFSVGLTVGYSSKSFSSKISLPKLSRSSFGEGPFISLDANMPPFIGKLVCNIVPY